MTPTLSIFLIVPPASRPDWLLASLRQLIARPDLELLVASAPDAFDLIVPFAAHLRLWRAGQTADFDPASLFPDLAQLARGQLFTWFWPGMFVPPPAALSLLHDNTPCLPGHCLPIPEGQFDSTPDPTIPPPASHLNTGHPALLHLYLRPALLAQHPLPDFRLVFASHLDYHLRLFQPALPPSLPCLALDWRWSQGAIVQPPLPLLTEMESVLRQHRQPTHEPLRQLFVARWQAAQRQWPHPQLAAREALDEAARLPASLRPAARQALAVRDWGQAAFDALQRFDLRTAARAVRQRPALLRNRGLYVLFLRIWTQRCLLQPLRAWPDFLIIGAQRSGTTSLYNYLAAHPHVAPVREKELHFFDLQQANGPGWYRTHFPLRTRRPRQRSGEATPMYLFHPRAPVAVHRLLPHVRLIVLLRDPVQRAYSHFQLERNLAHGPAESLSFAAAVEAETARLAGEREKMLANPAFLSFPAINFSYLARGLYVDQIQAWRQFFPPDQMLILRSEDFYERPAAIFQQTLDFLALPAWQPDAFRPFNRRETGAPLDPALQQRLRDFFRPHNQRLAQLLGRDFAWDDA